MGELIFFRPVLARGENDYLTNELYRLAEEHLCEIETGSLIPQSDKLVLVKIKGAKNTLLEIQKILKEKKLFTGHHFPNSYHDNLNPP